MEELKNEQVSDAAEADETVNAETGPNGWLESIYEHFRIVPLKALDCFIVVCIIALITVVTVGVLRARGIL